MKDTAKFSAVTIARDLYLLFSNIAVTFYNICLLIGFSPFQLTINRGWKGLVGGAFVLFFFDFYAILLIQLPIEAEADAGKNAETAVDNKKNALQKKKSFVVSIDFLWKIFLKVFSKIDKAITIGLMGIVVFFVIDELKYL
jgi:hypothetical protein